MHSISKLIFFGSVIMLLLISACTKVAEQTEEDTIQSYLNSLEKEAEQTESGLYVIDYTDTTTVVGQEHPQAGDSLILVYSGYLAATTSSVFVLFPEEQPDTIIYRQFETIEGWDEGLSLLTEGMTLKIVMPSKLAYGDNRIGIIPPNSPLVFDINLVKLQK